jgi:hypothetical protein
VGVSGEAAGLSYFYAMKLVRTNDAMALWFSRILRWLLGAVFIVMGIIYLKQDATAWALIGFGVIAFVSGFFRPRRCLDDNCQV